MKSFTFPIFFILMSTFFCLLSNKAFAQDDDDPEIEAHFEKLAPEEFHHLLDFLTNEQLVDLRHELPYKKGHIFNSVNIPYHSGKFHQRIKMLDKSRPLLIYSDDKGELKAAVEFIVKQGFIEIYVLSKGFKGWQKKGLTIVK